MRALMGSAKAGLGHSVLDVVIMMGLERGTEPFAFKISGEMFPVVFLGGLSLLHVFISLTFSIEDAGVLQILAFVY